MGIVATATAERSFVLRRWGRRLRAFIGGLLLFGASAAMMAIVILPLIWFSGIKGPDDEPRTVDEELVHRLAGRGWLLAMLITFSGWATGRYLLRGRRGTALWLRRFRFDEATRVVSASLDYIGRSWRVVTLDDAETESVGVSAGLRFSGRLMSSAVRIGGAMWRLAPRVGKVVTIVAVGGIVATLALAAYQGEFFDVLDSALSGNGWPDEPKPLIVLLLVCVLLLEFALLLLMVVVALAMVPLIGLSGLLGQVRKDVNAAESAKNREVHNVADVEAAAHAVAAAGQGVVAPRLTVLTVDSAVWQETVTALARISSVVVIDVSQVTQNLLWEVEEMSRLHDSRLVLIGERDHLRQIVESESIGAAEGDQQLARLRSLLDGRHVLSYTDDLLGRWRFQRALFGDMEATRAHLAWQPRTLKRAAFALGGVAAFVMGVNAAVSMVLNEL